MALGLMVTPAVAADGVSGVVQDFFEWSVNAQRETGDAFWRAIYGDSWNPDGGFSDGVGADRTELLEKYGVYTETIFGDFGSTTIDSTGAVRLYFDFADAPWSVSSTTAFDITTNAGGIMPTVTFVYNDSTNYSRSLYLANVSSSADYPSVVAPALGTWTRRIEWVANNDVYAFYGKNGFDFEPIAVTAGSSITATKAEWAFTKTVAGSIVTVQASQWADFYPTDGLSSITTVDVAEASRAGSIAGDVYVVNENGEEVVYNDYSVVNETTNIYNDPISGTERPMEDWAYDYIERQYNITLEDGANVTVKYGDENIEIVEGDSIETLNYGSGSSGESGGDGDGGGTGIGDAIANLFTVLGEIILGLITALISLATRALDALKGLFELFGQLVETITGFFGGFTDFLAGVFPFLPEETFTIFNFGLILLVAATVFRKFLK